MDQFYKVFKSAMIKIDLYIKYSVRAWLFLFVMGIVAFFAMTALPAITPYMSWFVIFYISIALMIFGGDIREGYIPLWYERPDKLFNFFR